MTAASRFPPAPPEDDDPDTSRLFMSSLPPGRRERRFALATVLVSAVIFAALAPFAGVPLAPGSAFIPVYQSAIVVNDMVTAGLLLGQYAILRQKPLLVLAGGYLFTGFMAGTHMLSFPGCSHRTACSAAATRPPRGCTCSGTAGFRWPFPRMRCCARRRAPARSRARSARRFRWGSASRRRPPRRSRSRCSRPPATTCCRAS